MRLDDMPRSDNVEDRRGQNMGAGGLIPPDLRPIQDESSRLMSGNG